MYLFIFSKALSIIGKIIRKKGYFPTEFISVASWLEDFCFDFERILPHLTSALLSWRRRSFFGVIRPLARKFQRSLCGKNSSSDRT